MDKLLSDTPHFDNLLLKKTISYAQKIGWQQVPHPNQNIMLFQRSTDELDRPVQLVLPSSATFWDSSILLDKAIKLLATSENTSSQEIIAAIQSENNSAEPVRVVSNPLRGEALLQKVSGLLDLPKREWARKYGYYTDAKNNQARVNIADSDDALLAANSLLTIHAKQKNERAQQGIYRVRVDKRGQITISAKYTQIMGLKPGDEFEVKLSSKQILAKNNQARVSIADSDDALLAANSLLTIHAKQKNERAQQGIYRVRVDKRGQITISAKYTQIMGLKPGDEFEVKLSSKQILLCHLEKAGNKQPIN